MTDPTSVLVGLFTNEAFGIPLLILTAVTLFWIVSRYGHLPPQFRPIGPDRSWVKGPFAWVEEGVAADQIVPGVAYASYRVQESLRRRFGVDPIPSGPLWSVRRRVAPQALYLIQVDRKLAAIYRLAWLAESGVRNDLVSRWRRPAWRRQSRAMFADILTELESVLPGLEAAS